jgi:hypothetical protein
MYFADIEDIFHMYTEMDNDKRTEMHIKFQVSCIPSVFVMTLKVGGICLNVAATNHVVITQKIWELNQQWQTSAHDVQFRHNPVPHTWLLKMSPCGYGMWVRNHDQQSELAQLNVIHSVISNPNIPTSKICHIWMLRHHHSQWLTDNADTVQSDKLSF